MPNQTIQLALRIFIGISLLALSACKENGTPEKMAPSESLTQKALTEARQTSKTLGMRLKKVLLQELKAGGFENAAGACAESAQAICKEVAAQTGHDVRRVSLGYRNPADIPDDYERAKLEEFDRLNQQKKLATEYYEIVRQDGQAYLRYLKPLTTSGMCLKCHGDVDDLSAEVKTILNEKYPEDKATGYHKGDVRGAISVRIALDAGM